MSVDIYNLLGAVPEDLAQRVEKYFENEQNSVRKDLAALNELIGFPYRLRIDWTSIRESVPIEFDSTYLVDYVCLCTSYFLVALRNAAEHNEAFSEVFIEKTKTRNRVISVLIHCNGKDPYTRLKPGAAYPILELYLPAPPAQDSEETSKIAQACGGDLQDAFTGLSPLDPLRSGQRDEDFLPFVKDLPRPELALNQGPIYVRLIESLPEGNKGAFDLEGPQAVLELMRDYFCKHAKDAHGSTSFYHWLRPHRFGDDVYVLRITDSQYSLSPMIVPSILECNLGFHRVGEPITAGGKVIWLFRREKAFKLR